MQPYYDIVSRQVKLLEENNFQSRNEIYSYALKVIDEHIKESLNGDHFAHLVYQKKLLEEALICLEKSYSNSGGVEYDLDTKPEIRTNISSLDNQRISKNKIFLSNIATSGAVSIFKAVLQLVMLPVMARLLTPSDYGLYALALPTVLFFVLLADGGLGLSLSREDEGNITVWSTAFWALFAICLIMACFVAASGFLLSWLADQPSLVGIMSLLSLSLPILAFMVPADARLIRRGNLVYHSLSDLCGSFLGAGVAVFLAYKGAGAWSLAFQYVVSFAFRAIVLNVAGWVRPSFVFKGSSLGNHFKIASSIIFSRMSELFGKLSENYIFENLFQLNTLGSYNMANQVSRFSCESIVNPLIGSFYAHILHQNDEDTQRIHLNILKLLLCFLFPIVLFVSIAGEEFYVLTLGEKWRKSYLYFQIIASPYSLMAISWFSLQVLLKKGIVNRSTKLSIIYSFVRVLLVCTGIFWSATIVIALIAFSYVLQAISALLIVPRDLGANRLDLLSFVWLPMTFTIALSSILYVVVEYYGGSLFIDFLSLSVGFIIYIALLWIFCFEYFKDELKSLRHFFHR